MQFYVILCVGGGGGGGGGEMFGEEGVFSFSSSPCYCVLRVL